MENLRKKKEELTLVSVWEKLCFFFFLLVTTLINPRLVLQEIEKRDLVLKNMIDRILVLQLHVSAFVE